MRSPSPRPKPRSPEVPLVLRVIATLTLLALAGCGGELATPGEPLRILDASLPTAFVGERYDASVPIAGGLRPFRYALVAGSLPEGLDLASGVVAGVPRETGTFTFTLEATDANLSRTVRELRLDVEEIPPPSLRLVLPPTEVRSAATVRVAVEGRELRGVRTELRWDPAALRLVEGSVRTEARDWAVFHTASRGALRIDAAALGASPSGEVDLARFELEPLPPSERGAAAANGGAADVEATDLSDGADGTADAAADGEATDRGVRIGLRARTEFRARGGHSYAESREGAFVPVEVDEENEDGEAGGEITEDGMTGDDEARSDGAVPAEGDDDNDDNDGNDDDTEPDESVPDDEDTP